MKVPPQLVVLGAVGIAYGAYMLRLKCMSNVMLCGKYMRVVEHINKKRFNTSIIENLQYSMMRNECINRGLI